MSHSFLGEVQASIAERLGVCADAQRRRLVNLSSILTLWPFALSHWKPLLMSRRASLSLLAVAMAVIAGFQIDGYSRRRDVM